MSALGAVGHVRVRYGKAGIDRRGSVRSGIASCGHVRQVRIGPERGVWTGPFGCGRVRQVSLGAACSREVG